MGILRRTTTIKKPAVKRTVKPKATRIKGTIKISEPTRVLLQKKNHVFILESKFKPLAKEYPESKKYVALISNVYLNAEKEILALRERAKGHHNISPLIDLLEGRYKQVSKNLINFINEPKPNMFRFMEVEMQASNYLKELKQIEEILGPKPTIKEHPGKGDYNPRRSSLK
jgi:hypothetical protein